MRKPRDIDTELKALQEKQKQLRARRTTQLGELVTATGAADAFDPETLAGTLLEAVERARSAPEIKEAWQRKGEGFFRREKRKRNAAASGSDDPGAGAASDLGSAAQDDGRAAAE